MTARVLDRVLDDERRRDERAVEQHVDVLAAQVGAVVARSRARFDAAAVGDVEPTLCDRCHRPRRPWPLRRRDVCAPRWWACCIRGGK